MLHLFLEAVHDDEVSLMVKPIRRTWDATGKVTIPSCRIPGRFDHQLRLRHHWVLLRQLGLSLRILWMDGDPCRTSHGSKHAFSVARPVGASMLRAANLCKTSLFRDAPPRSSTHTISFIVNYDDYCYCYSDFSCCTITATIVQ